MYSSSQDTSCICNLYVILMYSVAPKLIFNNVETYSALISSKISRSNGETGIKVGKAEDRASERAIGRLGSRFSRRYFCRALYRRLSASTKPVGEAPAATL